MSLLPYLVHHRMLFVLVSLLLCMTITRSCNEKERQALLDIKANLVDKDNKFHNWGNKSTDCCQWEGVSCDEETGDLITLDLYISFNDLSGNISSLLPLLSQLKYLDLRAINFQLSPIQNSFGSLTNLQSLRISQANLSGSIPRQLGNLSKLTSLDLSGNFLSGSIPHQLANLSKLTSLDLSRNSLSGSIPHQLANLSKLTILDLRNNSLSGPIPVSFGDLTSLTYLGLSSNRLEGVIPISFGNLLSLEYLDLSGNSLSGPLPGSFGNLLSLEYLDLSGNSLSGLVPASFGDLFSLTLLNLSRNQLTGNLPNSLGKLSNLVYLDFSSNSLEGLISDDHLLNLTQLIHLDLSFNPLALNLSSNARLRFKLKTIRMQSCKLGPSFPMWIKSQRDFEYLDISNAGISDHVPRWFWDLPRRLKSLNLSSNEIKGMLPNKTLIFDSYPGMDLSNNQLQGIMPVLPLKLASLNLSGNRFSGTLSFLCQIDEFLTFLDLSSNLLTGGLPDCSLKFQEKIVILNLSNNSLSGKIPSSLGFMSQLQALYLRKNAFDGEIPMALSNCTKLRFVDLGENKLIGNLPSWIGETLSELYVLVLRANRLNGRLPSQICLLNNLQVLDLSTNELSGNIPRCYGNFKAMATRGFQNNIMSHSYSTSATSRPDGRCGLVGVCRLYSSAAMSTSLSSYVSGPPVSTVNERNVSNHTRGVYKAPSRFRSTGNALFIDNALVAWKGTRREFGKGLYLLKSIDISSNELYGKLPDEITNLHDLVSLNLSNNKLHGQVPKHMGRMSSLQSLDLSRNEFSGNIPWSLSQITFLGYLDLSYNNLSGRIPTGTQLQGFNSSAYMGNPELCGPPLTQSCGLPPPPGAAFGKEAEDGDELWKSYYTGMGIGFTVGFSVICGFLSFNRRGRYIFFASLNTMKDWIYVTTVVHFRNLHMIFQR